MLLKQFWHKAPQKTKTKILAIDLIFFKFYFVILVRVEWGWELTHVLNYFFSKVIYAL